MRRARFTVYLHTSPSANGYVGQTVDTMDMRWKAHVAAAKAHKGCPVLGAAIRKYGEHAFKHEVLDVVTTQIGADIAETRWIEARQTRVPHGYNLAAGGGGFGRHHEISKRLISEASKRSWDRSPERRKAQSERTPSVQKAHDATRKIWGDLTVEERSDRTKRQLAGMTPEQLSERVRKAWANATPESRAERVLRMSKPRREGFSERQSAWQTARQKTLTPEQRSENTRKAWVTRRAKIALQSKKT